MSRATFIRHFQERLGRSASELLTDIRMTVAANALKTSDMSTGAVAELAGYQSEAASRLSIRWASRQLNGAGCIDGPQPEERPGFNQRAIRGTNHNPP